MLLKANQSTALTARLAALIGLIAVVPAHSGGAEISVVGAIEAVNCQAGTLQVLGITFAATDAGVGAAVCRTGSPIDLRFVSASGSVRPDGTIALSKLVGLSAGQYVPGATPIYIRGTISDSNASSGIAVLSGAVVSLAGSDLAKGSVVEILGTQPALGGVVLPITIQVVDAQTGETEDSVSTSSIGSGVSVKSSIGSGTSVNSSIGSGTSVNSSIGSGVSVNSSIGSGTSVKSSIGSGLN